MKCISESEDGNREAEERWRNGEGMRGSSTKNAKKGGWLEGEK